MSINKNSTYVSNVTQPVMHAVIDGYLRTRFLHRLQWLSGWLARWRNEKSHPIVIADFELGNERFAETGYYRVSAMQTLQEHTIDIHTVNLLQPRIQ